MSFRQRAELCLQNLTSLSVTNRTTEEDNAHAKNGKNRTRVRKLLKSKEASGCGCQRRHPCCSSMHCFCFLFAVLLPAVNGQVLETNLLHGFVADARIVLVVVQERAGCSFVVHASLQHRV